MSNGSGKLLSVSAVGRLFEAEVCEFLNQRFCGVRVHSRGGANDRGLDLQGRWDLGTRSIEVLGQCKWSGSHRAVGARNLREFMGSVPEDAKKGVLGLYIVGGGWDGEGARFSREFVRCMQTWSSVAVLVLGFRTIVVNTDKIVLDLEQVMASRAVENVIPGFTVGSAWDLHHGAARRSSRIFQQQPDGAFKPLLLVP